MTQNSRSLLFVILAVTMLTVACGSATRTTAPLDLSTETPTKRSPTAEPLTVTTPPLDPPTETPTRSFPTAEPLTSTPSSTLEATALQSSPEGDLAQALSDPASPISAGNIDKVEQLFTLTGYAVAFPSDATTVTTGGLDGMVRIWSLADGTLERELATLDGMIFELVYAPDDRLLAGAAGESASASR